ncbi:MAG: cytochrome C oxidase subunit IV family protein, partial [Proteobacteria bacterium]|nr:cytochrome C oxidase subunit IV family protein [Pseudomonadota bacterium]
MADHEAEYITVPMLPPLEKSYVRIWAILLVLLLASVVGPLIGEMTGMMIITLITAFGIAFVKAWLVIKEFMHLTEEPPVIHYILITCIAFMFLFFAAVAPDVMNHHGSRWVNVAAIDAVERGMAAGEAGGHGHGEHAAPAGDHAAPAGDHAAPAGDHAAPAGDHAAPAGDHAA